MLEKRKSWLDIEFDTKAVVDQYILWGVIAAGYWFFNWLFN